MHYKNHHKKYSSRIGNSYMYHKADDNRNRPYLKRKSRNDIYKWAQGRGLVAIDAQTVLTFFDTSVSADSNNVSREPVSNMSTTTTEAPIPQRTLTRSQQLESYCGMVEELVAHARTNFSTTGGMGTTAVRNWYMKNPHFIPEWLRDKEWTVDHIVSDNLGGFPWPYNYFLMPKSDNSRFGKWATKEKEAYVGKKVFGDASAFARWCRHYARNRIDFARHDPVSATFLGRA